MRSRLCRSNEMKYTHYPRHRGLPGPSTVVPASGKPKYSCPMHPEVQQRHLDNCPQCGMTLIPMTAIASTDEQENTLLRAMTTRFWIVAALTLPVFVLALAHAIPALARLPWAHSGASLESIVSRRCRMNAALVLFAGAISTSMGMGASKGKRSEEQCRAKYGRYTCADEARLKAAQSATTPIGVEQTVLDCCQSLHQNKLLTGAVRTAAVNAFRVEERNRVQYGRYSHAKEAQLKAAREELAMHRRKCRELGQCPPMPTAHTAATSTVAAISGTAVRSLAKYGRMIPVNKQPPAEAQKAEMALAAAGNTDACEHA